VSTKLPADLQAQIEAHIGAFNAQDHERFLGVFGDTAIIIDGIAPYRWLNPNAPANWLADVERWRQQFGVTHEHISYEMGSIRVRRDIGDPDGHNQRPGRRSRRHARLHIREPR